MSSEIPFVDGKFVNQGTHVAIQHVIDDATLNEVIDRINGSIGFPKRTAYQILAFVLVCTVIFAAGWVMVGVGLSSDMLGLFGAGLGCVFASVLACIITGIVNTELVSQQIRAAVAAENKRFAGHQPPVTLRLYENIVYDHHRHGSVTLDQHTERKLIIETGHLCQPDASTNQPMKSSPECPQNGPASTTVAPNEQHSINMPDGPDHSMTRA